MAEGVEVVTTYKFARANGKRVNVRVLYDNESKCVTHEYDDEKLEDGVMPATWWLRALSLRPRDKMFKNNRILYDFLQARIGE